MIRSICAVLLAIILVSVSLCAQAQPFVWRVAGDDNTVYLAGAMHLLPERAYPLPGAFDKAYTDADVLVVEADQRQLESPAAQRQMLDAAHYREGGLVDHLDESLYDRARSVLQDIGLSADRMNAFRPWFVAMTIELQAYRGQAFQQELGVDVHYAERAMADGKPILPLAPIAAHLAVFTDMPEALGDAMLASTLDNAEDLGDSAQEIYGYWRTGDTAGLARSVHEQAADYPALYDRLIFDRNTRWMDTVTTLLHSPGNAMILVGAVHLVGDQGLVARLRKQGYRVTRLD